MIENTTVLAFDEKSGGPELEELFEHPKHLDLSRS